ncbi:MAG: hypothetical protein ACP5KH_06670 [Thermodesulfovibrio sp.]
MSNGVIFLFLVLILSSSSFAFAVENEIGASIRLRQEILDNFIYLGTTVQQLMTEAISD